MPQTSLASLTSVLAVLLAAGGADAQIGNVRPLTDLVHTVSLPNPVTIPNPPIPGAPVSVAGPRVLPIGVPLPLPREVRRPIQLPGAPSLPGLDNLAGFYVDFDAEPSSPGDLSGLPGLPTGGSAPGLADLSLPDVALAPNGMPSLPLPPSAGVGDGPPSLPELDLPPPVVSINTLAGAGS